MGFKYKMLMLLFFVFPMFLPATHAATDDPFERSLCIIEMTSADSVRIFVDDMINVWDEGVFMSKTVKKGDTFELASKGGNWVFSVVEIDYAGVKLEDKTNDWVLKLPYSPVWMGVCYRGDIKTLRSLLSSGAMTVNTCDAFGRTPLMLAAFYEHKDLVRFLLGRGAKPDLAQNEGLTALMLAAGKNFDIAKALVKAGANVNARDKEGRLVLQYAVKSPEVMELLFDKKAVAKGGEAYDRALLAAVMHGTVKTVKIMLKNGADAKASVNGEPIIRIAAHARKDEMVALLATYGAES